MGLNDTPSGERIHIGFFGLRNAGKSSLVNAVTGQDISIVSETKGTTTDPVKKNMELLPIGPVVIIDTPGIDDEGSLGKMRVKKALSVIDNINVAVLVIDSAKGLSALDNELINTFKSKNISFIKVYTKSDLLQNIPECSENNEIYVSASTGLNIYELKELIGKVGKPEISNKHIVADLINPGDVIVLVTPIDSAAPKGRLILPQQQTIRDILDAGAISIVTKETELEKTLSSLKNPPKMVITDSQAFGYVNKVVPKNIPLTSFSILFARYKGDLDLTVRGAAQIDKLKKGDTVLISEGCTHHRQCGDIGTEKLPKWLRNYVGDDIKFEFSSGNSFSEDLSKYSLVIHCGGCMLNEKEMKTRQQKCIGQNVNITNYGIAIAKLHGILERSLEIFPETLKILK